MKDMPEQSPKKTPKRILVVDDHPLTRQGVSQLLDGEHDLMVCGGVENAWQAMTLVESQSPDLVLTDITLPSRSGLEFIKDMKKLHPHVPVLVMSMHDENIYAERALRAGARGYIMKSENGQNVLVAIRRVLQNQIYVSEELSQSMVGLFVGTNSLRDEGTLGALTDREFEVFELIGQGLSTVEIGHRLCISPKTVETHRMHLKDKLKLKTAMDLSSQAVQWAASNQLV